MLYTSNSFFGSDFKSGIDDDINALFDGILNRGTRFKSSDVEINNAGATITVQVPGHSKESLEITTQDNVIKLSSIPDKTPKKFKALNLSWKDAEGKFDLSKISATCTNGILTITLPIKESKKPVTVEIK